MAATVTEKSPPTQTDLDDLKRARAVARACFNVLKYRMSFDRKTMAWLKDLAAANPWLEE